MNSGLRILALASTLAAIAVAGCSSFRVVEKSQTGGVVALSGPRDDAHQKAEEFMAAQCPLGYQIVDEGEAVIGEDTQGVARPSVFGGGTTATSTTQKTEWRIKYQCKGTASPEGEPVVTGVIKTVAIPL